MRFALIVSVLCGVASTATANDARLLTLLGPEAATDYSPTTGTASVIMRRDAAAPLPPGAKPLWGPWVSWRGVGSDAPFDGDLQGVSRPAMDVARAVIRSRVAHESGLTGAGVVIGIVDSGLDLKHRDFRDAFGNTRVRWLLDYSQPPAGLHPELEARYAVSSAFANGKVGAVYAGADLQRLIDAAPDALGTLPVDKDGHGTHVAGIAAAGPSLNSRYSGVAPDASLIVVKAVINGAAEHEMVVRGSGFVFDQADALGLPSVVNLSLSENLGAHDGTSAFEGALASLVGEKFPGRALVVAAGNAGVASFGIHQRVYVSKGQTVAVPVNQRRDVQQGLGQIYVSMAPGAEISVGFRGPDGIAVTPVSRGGAKVQSLQRQAGLLRTAVVYRTQTSSPEVAPSSNSAVVAWRGPSPRGQYEVLLDGEGLVDLYIETIASSPVGQFASFREGVREGTVGLPATHPTIIAVGCTNNRASWNNILNKPGSGTRLLYDPQGGLDLGPSETLLPELGQICGFSGAGPTTTGLPRPDISAPGYAVAAAMSAQADPRVASQGMFADVSCLTEAERSSNSPSCSVVDDTHALSSGTSMSSPMVGGAVALLFQADRTLTQFKVRSLLQAGAQRFRGAAPFFAQSGPGELDVAGALQALSRSKNPVESLPSPDRSWLRPSDDYSDATGRLPTTLYLELRNSAGEIADFFDDSRLALQVQERDSSSRCPLQRMAPGLWTCVYRASSSASTTVVSFTPTFDGAPLLAPLRLRTGAGPWPSRYAARLLSGCGTSNWSDRAVTPALSVLFFLAAMVAARRRTARPSRRLAAEQNEKV